MSLFIPTNSHLLIDVCPFNCTVCVRMIHSRCIQRERGFTRTRRWYCVVLSFKSYIKQEEYVFTCVMDLLLMMLNGGQISLFECKITGNSTTNIGTHVSIKPVSLDVTELGNYDVLLILSSYILTVSLSCPACLTLTLQL